MSTLHSLWAAMESLHASLHGHGPACVCPSCQTCQAATALLPRLDTLLAVLRAWSRAGGDDAPLLPRDIAMALALLEEESTVRPGAAVSYE